MELEQGSDPKVTMSCRSLAKIIYVLPSWKCNFRVSKSTGNVLAHIPYQFSQPEMRVYRPWPRNMLRSCGLMELVDDFLVLKGYISDLAWDVNRLIESYLHHYHRMAQTQSDHNTEGSVDGTSVIPTISIMPDINIRLDDRVFSKNQTHYSRKNIIFISQNDGEHGRRFSVWDQHEYQSRKYTQSKTK